MAKALGDVSADQVWRVLRKHGIHLQRRRSWCVSTDPKFAQKAADIVGLYYGSEYLGSEYLGSEYLHPVIALLGHVDFPRGAHRYSCGA